MNRTCEKFIMFVILFLLFTALILLPLSCAVFCGWKLYNQEIVIPRAYAAATRLLAPNMANFLEIPGLTSNESNSQYIVGKIVVVNISPRTYGTKPGIAAREIDRSFLDLPMRLRAVTPEEVGTVVWLDWNSVIEARYESFPYGGSWSRVFCKVTLIDMKRATVLGSKTLRGGGIPPESIRIKPRSTKGRVRYGPLPNITEYLTSLSQVPVGQIE